MTTIMNSKQILLCQIHTQSEILFIHINPQSGNILKCDECVLDEDLRSQDLVSIDQCERYIVNHNVTSSSNNLNDNNDTNSTPQFIQNWPPFINKDFLSKLKDNCFKNKKSHFQKDIIDFYDQLEREVTERIQELKKKALLSEFDGLNNEQKTISNVYEQISNIQELKNILQQYNGDQLQLNQNLFEFVQRMISNSKQNNQKIEQLYEEYFKNQILRSFSFPQVIKQIIIELISNISFSRSQEVSETTEKEDCENIEKEERDNSKKEESENNEKGDCESIEKKENENNQKEECEKIQKEETNNQPNQQIEINTGSQTNILNYRPIISFLSQFSKFVYEQINGSEKSINNYKNILNNVCTKISENEQKIKSSLIFENNKDLDEIELELNKCKQLCEYSNFDQNNLILNYNSLLEKIFLANSQMILSNPKINNESFKEVQFSFKYASWFSDEGFKINNSGKKNNTQIEISKQFKVLAHSKIKDNKKKYVIRFSFNFPLKYMQSLEIGIFNVVDNAVNKYFYLGSVVNNGLSQIKGKSLRNINENFISQLEMRVCIEEETLVLTDYPYYNNYNYHSYDENDSNQNFDKTLDYYIYIKAEEVNKDRQINVFNYFEVEEFPSF